MKSVSIYAGEHFNRGWIRRASFGVLSLIVVGFIVFGSKFYDASGDSFLGRDTRVNLVAIIILGGAYIYRMIRYHDTVIDMTITEGGLQVGSKTFERTQLDGFILEVGKKSGIIKNIVLVMNKNHRIYSFYTSDINEIESFVDELQSHIDHLEWFHQSGVEKFMRKIKL